MATTDYLKKKEISPTSQNDSGATIDKAQPVLVKGPGEPYSLSDASYTGTSISTQESAPSGLVFNGDGTKMFEIGFDSDLIYEYSLSTAYDISTASYTGTSISTQDSISMGLVFNGDGTKMFEIGRSSDLIYEYSLSTAGESKTGTGDIIIDDTNVSGPSDIAFYDSNGNLLPYELENESAITSSGLSEPLVGWVYHPNGWTRNDTPQAQVVYGNGPASSEENVTGTWDNTGQNAVSVWHLNENSGQTIDSTNNNIDSVNTTGTNYNVSGQFDGGRGFDGVDDEIDFGNQASLDASNFTELTVYVSFNPDAVSSGDSIQRLASNDGTSAGEYNTLLRDDDSSGTKQFRWSLTNGSGNQVNIFSGDLSNNTDYIGVGVWNGSTSELFLDSTSQGTASISSIVDNDNPFAIGDNIPVGGQQFDGVIDEVRIYSEGKNNAWVQADYDASPKAGQIFFSQSAAQTTVQTVEKTFNQDVSIEDRDRTKGFSQTVILENRNIPEQFTQDVAISDKDVTKTLDTDVAILDKDVQETFTQDVTLFDKDVEKTFSQTVSIKAEDQEATFSQDVFISEGNEAPFTQDVSLEDRDREKSFSTDLILENENIPEQFNQDVNIASLDNEQSFSQDLLVASTDNEVTFSQDVLVADQMTETFSNSVVIAKQPAPNVRNPLTVKNLAPTETFTKVLKPSNTYLKIRDVK